MEVTIALRHGINPAWSIKEKLECKAVQWWTKEKYFHAELIVNDCWVSAHFDGIKLQKLEDLNNEDWDYIDIDTSHISEYQEKIFYGYLEEQLGKDYDWKGIWFSQFIELGIHSYNKWFCSELVTKLLQVLGDPIALRQMPSRVSPGKLWRLYEIH